MQNKIIMAALLLLPFLSLSAQEMQPTGSTSSTPVRRSSPFSLSVYAGPLVDIYPGPYVNYNDKNNIANVVCGMLANAEIGDGIEISAGVGYRNYYSSRNISEDQYLDFSLACSWRLHQWNRFSLWQIVPAIGVSPLMETEDFWLTHYPDYPVRLHHCEISGMVGLVGKWQFNEVFSVFCSLQYVTFLDDNNHWLNIQYTYDQPSDLRILCGTSWNIAAPKTKTSRR